MRGVLLAALVSISIVSTAVPAAGPYLSPRDIVNAASLTPPRLPGGSIARGSQFQMSGVGIGPKNPKSDTHFPLKPSLAGVTVTATAAGVTYQAWPTFVSATSLRAVLPPNVPAGPVSLRLTFNGAQSNPVTVQVVEQSPGIFSVNGMGYGPGLIADIDHIDEDEDDLGAKAKLKNPNSKSKGKGFRRGDLAGFMATGLGTLSNPVNARVLVGGALAETFFVRKSSKRPGVDEVGFRIPPNAPLGCYVPVQAVVGGVASNAVTMEISGGKEPCSDPFNPASQLLREGGDVAFALLSRVVFQRTDGSSLASDLALAAGRTLKHDEAAFERIISWPPPGACTVYSGKGAVQFSLTGKGLPLGQLSVTNAARQTRVIPSFPGGLYEATWGRNDPAAPLHVPPPAFLDPGVFKFAGSGAGQVAPFLVQRTLEAPPMWTNAADVREVVRSADLLVEWSGAGKRQVFVMGSASSTTSDASASFQCLAPAGALSMMIPSAVVGRLPGDMFGSPGAMEVGAFAAGTPATFEARGLRSGVLFFTSSTAQAVRVHER